MLSSAPTWPTGASSVRSEHEQTRERWVFPAILLIPILLRYRSTREINNYVMKTEISITAVKSSRSFIDLSRLGLNNKNNNNNNKLKWNKTSVICWRSRIQKHEKENSIMIIDIYDLWSSRKKPQIKYEFNYYQIRKMLLIIKFRVTMSKINMNIEQTLNLLSQLCYKHINN